MDFEVRFWNCFLNITYLICQSCLPRYNSKLLSRSILKANIKFGNELFTYLLEFLSDIPLRFEGGSYKSASIAPRF